jgi:hypothetical protein
MKVYTFTIDSVLLSEEKYKANTFFHLEENDAPIKHYCASSVQKTFYYIILIWHSPNSCCLELQRFKKYGGFKKVLE